MSRDQSTEAELVTERAGSLLSDAIAAGETLEPRDRFDATARAMLELDGWIEARRGPVQGKQGGLFGGGR